MLHTVGAKVRHTVYTVDALVIQLAAAGDFLNNEKVRIEWEKLEKAPRSTTRSARGQPDNHAFTEGVLHWWKVHGSKFLVWAEAARIVFAFTPNSAAAERVFSMLKAMFGDQATNAFADYIQTATRMLRSDKRKVGRAARPGHWSVVLACGDCGLTVAPRLSCGAAAAAGIHKKSLTNRPATGEEPKWRSRAHKLDHASHTYFTSFPFPAPRATLCVGCGWGGENPRTA